MFNVLPKPQNEAPTTRPAIKARERNAECFTLNSMPTWGRASDTVVCQSCNYVNPYYIRKSGAGHT